jgi:Mg-chelatase subunit ChlD
MITLLHPIWLALAIPLLAAWWLWRPASHLLQLTRLSVLLLVLLAICGLAVRLPSRAGTVVVIADRSLSMPPNSDQKEAIDLIQRAMSSDDRLAVVSFGQQAVVERSPQTGAFGGFISHVDPHASNLSEAIEKAIALIPPNSTGRVLVISDGRWTGKDPSNAASRGVTRDIPIDYRLLERPSVNDLAIAQIDAPVTVTPGEAFMITSWIKSPSAEEINFELRRGGQVLAAGKTSVASGMNRLVFRDSAGQPGAQSYTLKILGMAEDPIPENDSAKILVGVKGPRPLLVVSSSQNSGLARLLSAGGMNIKTLLPEQCEWSLDAVAQYSGVLIENVPAEKIGEQGMEMIASWVTEAGSGMMITGGKNSYGPGGYFKSPLDAVMPVSMELRLEHRKFALAIAVTMDRSGSMAVEAGGGRTKMDLANLAAVQVLDMLSPMDEFGIIAVDSTSHIIADLNSVEANSKFRNRILQIDSGGGGIFIYEALTAASGMLLKAKAGTRHIVLFADAADSEEPGKYRELLEKCEQAGITVSVIGLGKPSDQDAELLRDIAKRGNGQIFFTENASDLPRLFAQDTIMVARNTFLEEPAEIQFTGGLIALTGKQFNTAPQIGGYNLTYLRPKANLAAVTTDQYQAPVTASWQAGGGRVLCYTGEADGKFTGAMAGWRNAGQFFTSLARWTAGDAGSLAGNMLITQEVRNGISLIRLHLDPERDEQVARSADESSSGSLPELPKVTTLRGAPTSKPSSEKAEMRWTSADTLEVSIPLKGHETALSTVEVAGLGRLTLSPVTLPYSPEFKPVISGEGHSALARLAKITGGKERIDVSGVWKDLARRPRLIRLAPWLLLMATLLLLLEVLERQTLIVSSRLRPKLQEEGERTIPVESVRRPQPQAGVPVSQKVEEAPEPSKETKQDGEAAIINALRKARKQARERNK